MNKYRLFFIPLFISYSYASEADKKILKSIEVFEPKNKFAGLGEREKLLLAELVWDLSSLYPTDHYSSSFVSIKTSQAFKSVCETQWYKLRKEWKEGERWLQKHNAFCNSTIDYEPSRLMAEYCYNSVLLMQDSRVRACFFIKKTYGTLTAYEKLSSPEKSKKTQRRSSWIR